MSNILQVTILRYPEVRGGVDTMVANLVNTLRRRHCISVFVPGDWDITSPIHYEVNGIMVYSLRLRLPYDQRRPILGFLGWLIEFPRTLFGLRAIVRRQRIDVIHAHMAKDFHAYLRALRWLGGPPYLITLHRGDVVNFRMRRKVSQGLVRFALGGAARLNAVSQWLAREAEAMFSNVGTVTCVYNGVDLSDGIWADEAADVRFDSTLPQRFFVMIGSFDPYKGHELAFRAWALLKDVDPDVHLVVIGEGDLRAEYEALIQSLGCGERVQLVGQRLRHEVLSVMRRSLGMVFPSRSEGFSYVLLEAGVVGIPVVCTRIGTFTEIITDGKTGLLVPSEDPAALAEAIAILVRDPALGKRLGCALRELVRERFTAEAMAAGYEGLYADILATVR